MELNYDGLIRISTGRNRKETKWKNKKILWSKFLKDVSVTKRTFETFEEYKKMSKTDRDKLKDVGGFVGGWLKDGKRQKGNVELRSLITLDADYVKGDIWIGVECFIDNAICMYSTHSNCKDEPRVRLVLPLKRPVTIDEYGAISRKIAEDIGMDFFDPTTFEANRLMYWPSTSKDGEFIFKYLDQTFLDPDQVLARYENWKDQGAWQEPSVSTKERERYIKKQQNPREKTGFVGAFCRTYSIERAIEKFLKDIYSPCEDSKRYTYIPGSSTGGLVIYENGDFAYSHHGTDKASGRLCNAFDLVRIHRFGQLDKDLEGNSTNKKANSYKAMLQLCKEDYEVKITLAREKFDSLNRDFLKEPSETSLAAVNKLSKKAVETLKGKSELYTSKEEPIANVVEISKKSTGEEKVHRANDDQTNNANDFLWLTELSFDDKGVAKPTFNNLMLILENDPAFKGKLGYNEFTNRPVIREDMPWRKLEKGEYWQDRDDAVLRGYIETEYQITSPSKVADALTTVQGNHAFHPVKDYLNSLVWDGKKRIETLVIDYLGALDNGYTRVVTKKILVAAVARIFQPGVKFDNVLVLVGPQGLGKSYFLKKLGMKWHSDSINTVQGKEAYEQLQGAWIIELAELSATRKSDVESVKHFISKQEDSYRVAYGKQVSVFPRQCVFFGTTNDNEFLRDKTGNRRFWPVVVGGKKIRKNLWNELTRKEIDQIWGEAVALYEDGEKLYLDTKGEKEAILQQELHTEESAKMGLIKQYLDTLLPENWQDLEISQRRHFLHGSEFGEGPKGTVKRTRVCTLEIWVEALEGDPKQMTPMQSREINDILRNLPNWKKYDQGCGKLRFGKIYGGQRAYVRVENFER